VAITGIAGPMAVRKTNPSALCIWPLAQTNHMPWSKRYVFAGTRTDIRRATVAAALELLLGRLTSD